MLTATGSVYDPRFGIPPGLRQLSHHQSRLQEVSLLLMSRQIVNKKFKYLGAVGEAAEQMPLKHSFQRDVVTFKHL